MIKMGVYVNDLNLHDSSRELILAGTQQSAELQLALDQVNIQIKSTIPTKQRVDYMSKIHTRSVQYRLCLIC